MRPLPLPAVLLLLVALGRPAPAAAQLAVLGRTVHEQTTRPGGGYSGTILVHNPSQEPGTARIYQTDYRFYADGSSHFDPPGGHPRSNAAWVALPVTLVTVPPGGTLPVHFEVKVPQADTLQGTYWSMVMVETVPSAELAPDDRPAEPSVGIVPVIRYGIQVVSHMERAGTRLAEFAEARVVETGTGRALELEVRNAGESAFHLELELQLFDADGAARATLRDTQGLLFPGTSRLQRFDLDDFPVGTYQALLIGDAGGDEVFGAQYTLRY